RFCDHATILARMADTREAYFADVENMGRRRRRVRAMWVNWSGTSRPRSLSTAMTIRDLLGAGRPTLSYELFPPRSPAAEQQLSATMSLLAATSPDFMSITYGASGSTRGTSRDVVHNLAVAHTIPPLAHLT